MDLPLTFLSVWIWAVGGWDSGPINQAGDFPKAKMWNIKVLENINTNQAGDFQKTFLPQNVKYESEKCKI